MKGVARGVSRNIEIVDVTHEIPPFNIFEGAHRLMQVAPFWPAGTVFVTVVDPGVGTQRRSIAARDHAGRVYVGPDNGLWTLVAEEIGFERISQLDEEAHRLPGSHASHTFHGRDLYAYVGARLAAGTLEFDHLGQVLEDVKRLELHRATLEGGVVRGIIPVLDVQFGNVWSNIPAALLEQAGIQPGDTLEVVIRELGLERFQAQLPFVRSFGFVGDGEALVYVNSLQHVALALNRGNFAVRHNLGSGASWTLELGKT